MRIEKIFSEFDGLKLEVAITTTVEIPKGIIQFSHGMAEHKERYDEFATFLAENGYADFAYETIVSDKPLHYGNFVKIATL